MDFTTLMETVEAANGRPLPDECHGLIAEYVREKTLAPHASAGVAPQLRMQEKLAAARCLYERFKHLDHAIRDLADDDDSDVVHRIAKELWLGLTDLVSSI